MELSWNWGDYPNFFVVRVRPEEKEVTPGLQ